MAFVGNTPSAVPLTGSQIADGTIVNANIATNTINLTQKVTSALAATNGGTGTSSYTAGNILYASNATTLTTLAPGTSGYGLTLNGTTPAWTAPSTGAMVFLGETSASNVATVDLNGYFTSAYDYYQIYIDDHYGSVNSQALYMRFATTGSYTVQTSSYYTTVVFAQVNATEANVAGDTSYNGGMMFVNPYISNTSTQVANSVVTIYNPMGSNVKTYTCSFTGVESNINYTRNGSGGGRWNSTTAITGVRFYNATGNITARKIRIYGIKNS